MPVGTAALVSKLGDSFLKTLKMLRLLFLACEPLQSEQTTSPGLLRLDGQHCIILYTCCLSCLRYYHFNLSDRLWLWRS
jgi:hypothetical protein